MPPDRREGGIEPCRPPHIWGFCQDSSGNVITSSPPTYHAWKIYTYQSGGTIPDAVTLYTLGSRGINTENAFSGGETVVGVAGTALFLDINITSTSQFIGGGYVMLTAPP